MDLQTRLRLGSSVTLRPQTVDRYGRTVAEVIGEVNLNLALVEDGMAYPLRGPRRRQSLTMAETDGLAQEQPGHHPGQEKQVAMVSEGPLLKEEGNQLRMEPGVVAHEGFVWCENPTLSRLPAHRMT